MFIYGTIYCRIIHYLLYGHVFNSIVASNVKSMLHIHTYQCYICTHTHQQQFLAWYVYLPATTSVLPWMHFCENTLAPLVLQSQRVLEGRDLGMGSVWHNVACNGCNNTDIDSLYLTYIICSKIASCESKH